MIKYIKRITTLTIVTIIASYLIFWCPLPFVSALWVRGETLSDDPLHIRHRIADGLLLFGTLDNLHRNEVETKLGPALDTDYFKNWDSVYWLGVERGFISIDSEWLVIRFDVSGNVMETRIMSD